MALYVQINLSFRDLLGYAFALFLTKNDSEVHDLLIPQCLDVCVATYMSKLDDRVWRNYKTLIENYYSKYFI